MSQKLLVNGFECVEDVSEFDESFIKSYNEEKDEGYFLKEYVQYPEKLYDLQNDLAFLPERMKTEKLEKLFANAHDKTEYVVFIRNLKQPLNHGIVFKKEHRVIKFN